MPESLSELWLISESPRRKQILTEAGFSFRVGTVKISEIIEENVNLSDAIAGVARAKAEAYLNAHKHMKSQNILVVSADTVVVYKNQPLGKPANSGQAVDFLRLLSGKTHSVITGIFVQNLATGESFQGADSTEVEFRDLSEDEIAAYVLTGEPLDKAGAYAIQGEGGRFVRRVSGSRLNVVGFPLELFEKVLEEKNWHVDRRQF